ncbi:CaiB/BaiF CoA transferase family protein [Dawidia soli]|uniref:CoA transferase n=1 Tax=Dawidia soli TaxID=2782352 RepID=A0AAP2D832_9BACT|nr:CaiB/BaiF CoA-transferase family protein [Dawidia soli]MBT1686879.1 CoA transferase [Dawidia soli]
MFSDLKIVELASVLAGPSVGQFFAELGAAVVKVENPRQGGDVTRTWKAAGEQTDDRSAYFCSANWGKQSIALDLTQAHDRQAADTLLREADMVIASYKPGDAEKFGMDYGTLSQRYPRLIYGQITGYGPTDPRVGYDAVLQAEAGFMYMNGEPGGPSLKMPVALVDVLAAHHLKEGLLLALLNRYRTGQGARVEVSLWHAAVSSLVNQATNWLVAGKLPQKQGSAHPNIAPYGDVYKTADGEEILVAVGSDRQFRDLCQVLDIAALADDPRYRDNTARVQNRLTLNSVLQAQIGLRTAQTLMMQINQWKIPAGFIHTLRQVFEVPAAQELLLREGTLAGVRNVAATLSFVDRSAIRITAPPALGEHTQEVLERLNSNRS